MICARTELIISVSKAKFDEEADFEVHWPPNPQNPSEKRKKLFFRTEKFRRIFFGRRKMKRRESSETRFPEFSWRMDVISGGKRTFEVSKNFRNLFLKGLSSTDPKLR